MTSSATIHNPAQQWAIAGWRPLLAAILIYASYLLLHLPLFYNESGTLSHDFGLALPSLLAGDYWMSQNGPFAPFWFSPSHCGGVPVFAGPQDGYYSSYQLFTYLLGPHHAITAAFALYAAIGMAGFYLLARQLFHCQRSTALLGATLFLFNGFYTYRMVVGHLGFNAIMLMPLIALLLFRPAPVVGRGDLRGLAAAAMLFAYLLLTGAGSIMIPLIMILLLIGLLLIGIGHPWRHLLSRFTLFGLLFTALIAFKLEIAFATLSNLPRESYSMPGFANLADAVLIPLRLLFIGPINGDQAIELMANQQWQLNQHEFEYGITPIPLLMIAIALTSATVRQAVARHPLVLFSITVIALLPIAFNYYSPEWNRMIKSIPLIRKNSNLIRWYLVYIPLVVLVATLLFDRWRASGRVRLTLASLSIALVILHGAARDRDYYAVGSYRPDAIIEAWQTSQGSGEVVPVSGVGILNRQPFRYGNDLLTVGLSQRLCYEPLFGYRLEGMPQAERLRDAPAMSHDGRYFNFKNPACYTYPEENGCQPGDHFTIGQRQELDSLLNYRQFPFNRPLEHHIFAMFSLSAWIFALLLFLLPTAKPGYQVRSSGSREE